MEEKEKYIVSGFNFDVQLVAQENGEISLSSINLDELKSLTSPEFAAVVQQSIDNQKAIRDVMALRVSMDADDQVVVLDFLVGWDNVPFALWTYWYDKSSGQYKHRVVDREMIDRFYAMVSGADILPPLKTI